MGVIRGMIRLIVAVIVALKACHKFDGARELLVADGRGVEGGRDP